MCCCVLVSWVDLQELENQLVDKHALSVPTTETEVMRAQDSQGVTSPGGKTQKSQNSIHTTTSTSSLQHVIYMVSTDICLPTWAGEVVC